MVKSPHIRRLQNSLRRCQDESIRRKLEFFLKVQASSGLVHACRAAGKAPRYYYYWWNRYRDSGFRLEALREKSRRPKHSPRQAAPEVLRWIRHYAQQEQEGPEKIRRRLEREHQIRISKSTIYRVLRAEQLSLRKKTSVRAKPHQDTTSEHRGSTSPSPMAPVEAKIFAQRYALEGELGRGGGGIVYLARDLAASEIPVALKTLELREGLNQNLVSVLKNEFRTLTTLQHPNLARVFDFGSTPDQVYFTSEYIVGRDLLSVAQEANLNTVFKLLVQVLRALDFLHSRGILHLDLKPGNILVTDPERTGELVVKLIDFGTSEWQKKGPSLPVDFAGTPPYAAPELILQQAPSPASDIYSFGMLCHLIFVGRFPFPSRDPVAMMKAQVYEDPQRVTELHPALPEAFADLLHRMVEKDPRNRAAGAREVLDLFNDCLGERFSLKDRETPHRVLDSTDHLFHPEMLSRLQILLNQVPPPVVVLSGPEGSGKSFLLRRLKESLQLSGLHPWIVEDRESLDKFLASPHESDSPLLIDGIKINQHELVSLLDRLENLRVPVLLNTRLPASPQLNPHHWLALTELTAKQLEEFCSANLQNFSKDEPTAELLQVSEGKLPQLELLFQAMVEEGMMEWSEAGWRWVPERTIPCRDLLPRQAARWSERLVQVQGLLRFASAGLDLGMLAGTLDIEVTPLREKLREWGQAGWLRSQIRQKSLRYFLARKEKSAAGKTSFKDWKWTRHELERRYEAGQFQTGAELAQLILRECPHRKVIPDAVAIAASRHLAAAGWAEKALELLPEAPIKDPALAALRHEIRARAYFSRGHLEEARTELDAAARAYRQNSDALGRSRVFNLFGSLYKRLGKLDEAETAFEEAVRAAQDGGDAYHQALALMNSALLQQDRGQTARAHDLYRAAFRLERELNQPLLSCKLQENWVNLLFYLGRSAEAEQACYALLKRAILARYPEQQASALSYLSLLAGQQERREPQLAYLQQALSLLDPRQHPQLYFQCLLDRAQTNWVLGKFTAAQIDAESALQFAEHGTNPIGIAMAQLLLAKILRDRPRPDLDASSRALNQAHLEAWRLQHQPLLWEIDFSRGLLAKQRGEGGRARNYFLTAQQTLRALLEKLPEETQRSYLRDRKWERLEAELNSLPASSEPNKQLRDH